jgi:hypothetical protein
MGSVEVPYFFTPRIAETLVQLTLNQRVSDSSRTAKATYGMQPERPPQQQPQRRSDRAKLCFEIYGGVWLRFVGKPLKNLAKASDFQAKYEGPVPFTCIFGHPNVTDAGEMDQSAVALIRFVVPVATWWNPLRMSTRGDFRRWGAHRASLCLLTLSNDILRRST